MKPNTSPSSSSCSIWPSRSSRTAPLRMTYRCSERLAAAAQEPGAGGVEDDLDARRRVECAGEPVERRAARTPPDRAAMRARIAERLRGAHERDGIERGHRGEDNTIAPARRWLAAAACGAPVSGAPGGASKSGPAEAARGPHGGRHALARGSGPL